MLPLVMFFLHYGSFFIRHTYYTNSHTTYPQGSVLHLVSDIFHPNESGSQLTYALSPVALEMVEKGGVCRKIRGGFKT